MPEVKLGVPSVVEAALLPGLIGWGRTRELLLFGENIDAATALRWGLVEQVVAPDALDAAVEARLDALLSCGPQAVRLQKRLIRDWENMTLDQAVRAGIESFKQAYATDEPTRPIRPSVSVTLPQRTITGASVLSSSISVSPTSSFIIWRNGNCAS